MKHANRHVSLSSAIQSTYVSVRLPNNCAWARSLPACGHHMLFVCWMTVAGNRARGDHQNRRLVWKVESRLNEHWESRYNAKPQWESNIPQFWQGHSPSKEFEFEFGAVERHCL